MEDTMKKKMFAILLGVEDQKGLVAAIPSKTVG